MIDATVRVTEPLDADLGLLDAAELARAARFRRDADRLRFATGRALVKSLVAELVGVDPHEVSVRVHCPHCGSADHGRPRATHSRGDHPVSISHSGSVVLAAATNGPEIGVDVEQMDLGLDHAGLGRHIESAAERGTVRDAIGFYRLWTGKEAILKCTGDGLMVPMCDLTLDSREDGLALVEWAGRAVPAITLRPLLLPGPYVASLAVATDQPLLVRVSAGGDEQPEHAACMASRERVYRYTPNRAI